MKKLITVAMFGFILLGMSSCFTYTYNVGEGPQKGIEVKGHNHYFLFGLIQGGQSDPAKLAGNSTDYNVKIQHSFIDGLIRIVLFGLYTPTTTTITK